MIVGFCMENLWKIEIMYFNDVSMNELVYAVVEMVKIKKKRQSKKF